MSIFVANAAWHMDFSNRPHCLQPHCLPIEVWLMLPYLPQIFLLLIHLRWSIIFGCQFIPCLPISCMSSYTACNTSPGPQPLDRSQVLTDPRVQDHAALSGQRPSVPSSRADASIANHSNMLRFVQGYFSRHSI